MRSTQPPENEIKVTDSRRPFSGTAEMLEKMDEKPQQKTLNEMIEDCFLEPGPGLIIVQPDDFTYRGKIFVPKTAQRTGQTGVIVKIGMNLTREFYGDSLNVYSEDPVFKEYRLLKPGDHVVYGMWAGTQLLFENRPSYRILQEGEILSIVAIGATKLMGVEA